MFSRTINIRPCWGLCLQTRDKNRITTNPMNRVLKVVEK